MDRRPKVALLHARRADGRHPIVGVLAAIALPDVRRLAGEGLRRPRAPDARNAATGEEAYHLDTSSYFRATALLPA
jgi:hypothetical protein